MAAILPKGRSSTANSGTFVAVLLGMYRCGNFPLPSAPYSLFSIWTSLKRSEKIPGAPTRRWGEWIRLTGPSGLHRNSPQGLNISFVRVFWPNLLILQPSRHFTYVRALSPTLPSLYLSQHILQPFLCSPISQFILQPFFRFSYSQTLHLIHLASRPCSDIILIQREN